MLERILVYNVSYHLSMAAISNLDGNACCHLVPVALWPNRTPKFALDRPKYPRKKTSSLYSVARPWQYCLSSLEAIDDLSMREDDPHRLGQSEPYKNETADQWKSRYLELKDYNRLHGHCDVPMNATDETHIRLARWVKRQRHQYKMKLEGRYSNMTDKRFNLLVSLGFVWNRRDTNWDIKFCELERFQQEFGHCRVPKRNPKFRSLSTWLKRQRHQWRLHLSEGDDTKSNITASQIAKLQSLGVKLDPISKAQETTDFAV